MRGTSRGFTLLELLIVITVIGILAAITIPSYTSYVQRGNRAVAKFALAELATRQESFFTDRKTYATTLSGLGYAGDTVYVSKNGAPTTTASSSSLYSVTLEAGATATSFTASATAYSPGQKKDTSCRKLLINNLGVRSALNASNTTAGTEDCWTR